MSRIARFFARSSANAYRRWSGGAEARFCARLGSILGSAHHRAIAPDESRETPSRAGSDLAGVRSATDASRGRDGLIELAMPALLASGRRQ